MDGRKCDRISLGHLVLAAFHPGSNSSTTDYYGWAYNNTHDVWFYRTDNYNHTHTPPRVALAVILPDRRLVDHGLTGNKLIRAVRLADLRLFVGEALLTPPKLLINLFVPLKRQAWQACVRRSIS